MHTTVRSQIQTPTDSAGASRRNERPARSSRRAGWSAKAVVLALGVLVGLHSTAPAEASGYDPGLPSAYRDVDRVGGYRPFSGDFDGDGNTDIFWYGPGGVVDEVEFSGPSPSRGVYTINGNYLPFVGDFNGDKRDDVYWYMPGTAPDFVWSSRGRAGFTQTRRDVTGAFTPVVGRFTSDPTDDILWYAPGAAADQLWDFELDGTVTKVNRSISGHYRPVVANVSDTVDGVPYKGIDDIVWVASDPNGVSSRWLTRSDGSVSTTPIYGIGGRTGTYLPLATAYKQSCSGGGSGTLYVPQYCFPYADPTQPAQPAMLFIGKGLQPVVLKFTGNSIASTNIGQSAYGTGGGVGIAVLESTGKVAQGVVVYNPNGPDGRYECEAVTNCVANAYSGEAYKASTVPLRFGRGGAQVVMFHPTSPDTILG